MSRIEQAYRDFRDKIVIPQKSSWDDAVKAEEKPPVEKKRDKKLVSRP